MFGSHNHLLSVADFSCPLLFVACCLRGGCKKENVFLSPFKYLETYKQLNLNSYSDFTSADSLKNLLRKAYMNVCTLEVLQHLNLFVVNSLIKNVTQLCCRRLVKLFLSLSFSLSTLPVRFTSWCIALSVEMQSWNGLDRHSFCFCCRILKMHFWAVYFCLHQLF